MSERASVYISVSADICCYSGVSRQDEREAREMVKREQDEAYRLSLEADRKKVGEETCTVQTPKHSTDNIQINIARSNALRPA